MMEGQEFGEQAGGNAPRRIATTSENLGVDFATPFCFENRQAFKFAKISFL
jgi:hypothetical protein